MNRLVSLILLLTVCLPSCSCSGRKPAADSTAGTPDKVRIDLQDIRKRGRLTAITSYSATSYFIYKGQPMGYEYELLQRLTDYLDLELDLVLAGNMDSVFSMLHEGKGDLIAHSITITKERKKLVAFPEHHTVTYQVLVQRKPENWRSMRRHELEKALIRNPLDLIGKKVHVRRNSSYYDRLVNLSEEMGGDIEIVPASGDKTTEDLIRMVANGEIDYTVADQNIAYVAQTWDPRLDAGTRVSFPQRIAWAVRKTSPELLAATDEWIRSVKGSREYNVIYNKYFRNRKAFRRRTTSEYFLMEGNKISQYDPMIREYAGKIGWDWRLLSALVYQESRFEPQARSWAGASGLMQLMPATARRFGVTSLDNPEKSLQAGTRYLSYLEDFWAGIPDSTQRLRFVLASYNAGENHIADARRLAEKYGDDPDVWEDNVEEYVLLLSKPKYYNDPVVEFGYMRGEEPYNYVDTILDIWGKYRKLISA